MKTLSLGAALLCIAGTAGCMNASIETGGTHSTSIGGDMTRTYDQDSSLSLIGGNMDLGGRVGSDVSLVGGNIDLDMDIGGDLSIAGGNLEIRGRIADDASIAGGAIDWRADVGEDLDIAGGDITLEGEVGRDLEAAGSELVIAERTVIRRDAAMAAARIEMNGHVQGRLEATAAYVQIRGSVDGFALIEADPRSGRRGWRAQADEDGMRAGSTNGLVEITGSLGDGAAICARRVNILHNADVSGDLRIWADHEPDIAAGAAVGPVDYQSRNGRDCDDIIDGIRAR